MEIRLLTAADDLYAVSRVYEESWRCAYRGLVPQDYLEFAAFKINALVDDKTTFEKAAEKWLKENPRYTGSGYHVASSSTAGNTQGGSGSSNASINDRIRAAARR